MRLPVEAVHNDYTEGTGPRRAQEILAALGRLDLLGHRSAFVNLWRPIMGPVHDVPLAVCDARRVKPTDIVDTPIHHHAEQELSKPRHSGEIQSARFSAAHVWYYFSEIRPEEGLLIKCYDAPGLGRARFVSHMGFRNLAYPKHFTPRESIEARTPVVY